MFSAVPDGNPDIRVDFVFQTRVIAIRSLTANAATYIYNDQNGHPLSVAPPNMGSKLAPALKQHAQVLAAPPG